jgi:hypothetical protein
VYSFDQAISVRDASRQPGEPPPVFPITEVVAAARSAQPAVVAVVGEELVGIAVAQHDDERAWVSMVGLGNRWRNRGSAALLAELELRLRSLGVRRIAALLPPDAAGTRALRNPGNRGAPELVYFEKVDPVGVATPDCWPSWLGSRCPAACGRR